MVGRHVEVIRVRDLAEVSGRLPADQGVKTPHRPGYIRQ